jgi:ABC-type phosphate/phosphonate transport system permease subunit
MEINQLESRENIEKAHKLEDRFLSLTRLLEVLQQKSIPDEQIEKINQHVDSVNMFTGTNQDFSKKISSEQKNILKIVINELKFVPVNYYRKLWTALGMSAFGIPFGVVFGLIIGNMAFLAIGLPIGMGVGMVVGSNMDKKAARENRQLDIVIKY